MKRNINDLRESLFDTMEMLKAGKLDVSQAKAMAEIGQVIVNSAKAETEFIDKLGGARTGFISSESEQAKKLERPPAEYSNTGHIQVSKKYVDA